MNTYPIKSWHILAITTPYAIGSIANLVVWLVNGGMPAKLNPKWAISHNGASLLTSHTRLAFLADIIHIRLYYFSIGDFLIYLFIPLYIGFTLYWVLKRLRRNQSWQKS